MNAEGAFFGGGLPFATIPAASAPKLAFDFYSGSNFVEFFFKCVTQTAGFRPS